MSTWDHRVVHCPRCATELRARVATGVHISRVPAVRDDILARRFHRIACGCCGAAIELQRPVVYTDFDRDHWILVATPDELARWPAYEARLRDDVARVFERGSLLAHPLAERLRARLVFGYEELREKLVVSDAGLDDALVECVKVRAFTEDPALAAVDSRLLVERCAGDALDMNWFARATDAAPTRALTTPPGWLRDTDRDRASLVARFPELFGGGFVSTARLLVR